MLKNKDPFKILKNLIVQNEDDHKKNKPISIYVVIIILVGILMMTLGNFFKKEDVINDANSNSAIEVNSLSEDEELEAFKQKNKQNEDAITNYEQFYAQQLKDTLETMIGVTNVSVVVNIDATNKKVFEKNIVTKSQITTEEDREGGKRKIDDNTKEEQIVIVQDEPLILETKKPQIRGVLVVAEGAENINVKKWIVEAVTRFLDVPSHRVAVMPKKVKGE